MNTCRRIQDSLVSFLSGELAGSETERIKRHLESCPACRREFGLLEQTLRAADSLSPEIAEAVEAVDWETQAEKITSVVWKNRKPRQPAADKERFRFFAPRLKPVLAGLLLGIIIGGAATFFVFKGSLGRRNGGDRFFASGEFLDRLDVEIARRETLDYLEKSQYVLLELAQSPAEAGELRLSDAAAREARELLSKKKFLNPQLEKTRMAKAKDICDQIELLFYELAQVNEGLTDAQRQELRTLIEQKNLLLKIKLLKKELQESEV
jgi:hypothetical protein